MDEFYNMINLNINDIIITMAAIILVMFIIILTNTVKLNKLQKRHQKITNNFNDKNLETILIDHYKKVQEVTIDNQKIKNDITKIKKDLSICVQKIGVIRYNAFNDVGSDLSYAIAIMDLEDNGFVINGIYSRESSTTYAKPVVNGQSKYPLSVEEMQAIDMAKRNHEEKSFILR
ncbi:MAG: DUF4446 family protein [Firmicutes bacterium]|nr:DUF4446 family protein [Bacillota bacterium]